MQLIRHPSIDVDPAEASDALRIAAHAHHLRDFARARASYPEGRAGYLVWRRDQKRAHAAALAELLIPSAGRRTWSSGPG